MRAAGVLAKGRMFDMPGQRRLDRRVHVRTVEATCEAGTGRPFGSVGLVSASGIKSRHISCEISFVQRINWETGDRWLIGGFR